MTTYSSAEAAPNVSGALSSAENALRDLAHHILHSKHGADWHAKSGVTEERVAKWRERVDADLKQRGISDPRLIYYADFYDLKTVFHKNWQDFKGVFGDKRQFDVFLEELEKVRNPDAHRRPLMRHEEHLVLGIAGFFRTSITKYFSLMDTREAIYPRLELVQDSVGGSYHAGGIKHVVSAGTLRYGDQLQFKVIATDPKGEPVSYGMAGHRINVSDAEWNETGVFEIELAEHNISEHFQLQFAVKSQRSYRATNAAFFGKVDDYVIFTYRVIPRI